MMCLAKKLQCYYVGLKRNESGQNMLILSDFAALNKTYVAVFYYLGYFRKYALDRTCKIVSKAFSYRADRFWNEILETVCLFERSEKLG